MNIKKSLAYASALATVFTIAPPAFAQVSLQPLNPDTVSISNVDTRFGALTGYTPSGFVKTLINVVLGVAGVVSFIFLLWGGIQWILAGGDKEGTEKARKRITAALIGLAIVFSAYALIYILRALFNIDLIQVELRQIGT